MTTYRLPGGKHTSSQRRYLAEWRKLTTAVERALGGRCYAFDPGIRICRPDGSGSFDLPVWAAEAIARQEEAEQA